MPTERLAEIAEFWLTRRPNGILYICWYDVESQQTQRISTGTRDLLEGEHALAAHAISNGISPRQTPAEQMTIGEILLRYYEAHGKLLPSAGTAKIASRYWLDFYGERAVVSDLTSDNQEAFHNFLLARNYTKSYADKIIDVGKSALNRAVKKHHIASFPPMETFLTKADKEAAPPKGRPMEIEEIGHFMNQFDESKNSGHVVKFIITLINTMCRPDAALDLSALQIDRKRGAVQLNPNGRVQTKKYRPIVPLTAGMAFATEGVKGHIVQVDGKPISKLRTSWVAGRTRAGLDEEVKPYSIRHTMSRYILEQDVSRYEMDLMLGHIRIAGAVSLIYAPLILRETRNAHLAVEKFVRELQPHTRHQLLPASSAESDEDSTKSE